MHIKCLEWVVYGPTGWGWKSHKLWHPAWDDIEQAIRRLDRFLSSSPTFWPRESEKLVQ